MKTKNILAAVIVGLVLAAGVTSAVLVRTNEPPTSKTTQQQEQITEQADLIRFTAEPDKTVLEQLANHAAIETKSSQSGVYIDVINGHRGGEDGKYWTFYVDGKLAQLGAEAYITKGGEIIEWKFE